jgi:hypothetical protein
MSASLYALTANRLLDGVVVFWSPDGWIEPFPQAALFESVEAAEGVLAEARTQTRSLIEPYAIEVRLEEGEPVPRSYRERVRALGPTVHPEMGKQAEGGPVIAAIQKAAGAGRSTGRLSLIRRK